MTTRCHSVFSFRSPVFLSRQVSDVAMLRLAIGRPSWVPADALETKPLKIDWTFYCEQCEGMASSKTCPHDEKHRLLLSGTKLRKLLSENGEVPPQFSRPEVLAILRKYYEGLAEHEKVKVELKGHSAR